MTQGADLQGQGRRGLGARLRRILTAVWAWLFLILMIAFFEVWSHIAYHHTFIGRIATVQSILLATTQTLLLAEGLTFLIVAAELDLSIGFVTGLAAVVAALLMQALAHIPAGLAFALSTVGGLAAAAVPGMINGVLTARLAVPSFIGTLGMYGVAEGVAYLVSGGTTVPIQNAVSTNMGNNTFLFIPIPAFIALLVTVVLHYMLSSTKFGTYTYAKGGSMEASVRAGINVSRHTMWLFVLSSLTSGLAGIIYTGRFSAGAAQAGEPTLLNAFAAVFIGGASLSGGSGTILGTVIGSLIIAVIQFGLVFINVQAYWQFVAVGIVIIVAVIIDQYRTHIASRRR